MDVFSAIADTPQVAGRQVDQLLATAVADDSPVVQEGFTSWFAVWRFGYVLLDRFSVGMGIPHGQL